MPTDPSKRDQASRILEFLKAGHSLTADLARDLFECARLAARINDLRKSGEAITGTWIKPRKGLKYMCYSLSKDVV
jgi:hypothetical protein